MSIDVLAGYALGALGIGLTLWTWLRPKATTSSLSWTSLTSSTLVRDEIAAVPSLQVTFRDRPLPRLAMWTGKIWNSGSAPIRGDELRGLQVQVPEGEILGAWLTRVSGLSNEVRLVTVANDAARLSFDYLNSGEGAEFTVLHTAPDAAQPAVVGSLVGGTLKRAVAVSPPDDRPSIASIIFFGVVVVGSFTLLGVLATLLQIEQQEDAVIRTLMERAIQSGTTTMFVIGGFLMWLIAAGFMMLIRIERAREPRQMIVLDRPTEPPARLNE